MEKKVRQHREILARRLANNGVPLTIEREDEDAGLLIHKSGAEMENCAFDLKCGRSGYMVSIRITVTHEPLTMVDIFLGLPWTDPGLSLIADPLESGARYGQYWFPGNDTLAFERRVVVNHVVNINRRLRRGGTIEGLLLWVGSEPIPDALVHGVRFPASVIVLDQFDNRYAFEVSMWADRSEFRALNKQKVTSTPGLFSRRDRSPDRSQPRTDTVEVEEADEQVRL